MKKIVFIFFALMLVIVIFFGIKNKNSDTLKESDGTIKVVASFYPLAHFAQNIVGSRAQVFSIVPSGVEPHDFEPTSKDVMQILSSDVFIFEGSGFEPWATRLLKDRKNKININAFQKFDGVSDDPHVWLDPILAIEQVEDIRDALVQADPAQRKEYERNAGAYIQKLTLLHNEYNNGLSLCRQHDIIVAHDAFRHLAARYGFRTIALSGLDPNEEPSSRYLKEVVDVIREKKIQYVFFETLASPRLAQTLAQETGTQTLILNPLEGLTKEERDQKENYLSLMRKNLYNLQLAMGCSR